MRTPRDHHFLPVFYLKQWAAPESAKLIEHSIKHHRLISKPVGPRATGFKTDLYSFPELPPELVAWMEKSFFMHVDDKASVALKMHLAAQKDGWSEELVSAWSRFLIGIHLRHPAAMEELRTAALSVWEKSGVAHQAGYLAIRSPDDPETFDGFLLNRDALASVKMQVNLIVRSFDNIILGNHFNKMHWVGLRGHSDPSKSAVCRGQRAKNGRLPAQDATSRIDSTLEQGGCRTSATLCLRA
jgi:Protein of unknown function (DUF4238)